MLSRGRTARQPFRVSVQFCKCKVVDPDEMMASSGFGLMAAASRTWLTLRTPKTTGKADADPGNRSRPAQSRSTPTSAKGARATTQLRTGPCVADHSQAQRLAPVRTTHQPLRR